MPDSPRTGRSLILSIGLGLVGLGLLVALVAGPGTRFGLWSFETGLLLQAISVLAAVSGGLILIGKLVTAWRRDHQRRVYKAVTGLIVSAILVGLPLSWFLTARQVPAIHDITTDPDDPPDFRAVSSLRIDAHNDTRYGGETVAKQQRRAYPDIKPLRTSASRDRILTAVRRTARDLGWRTVAVDTAAGRFEAVATTFWFGFKDDVVVRLHEEEDARTRVDVRSASRVGQSDLGTNARRIREFLNQLQARLNASSSSPDPTDSRASATNPG